MPCFRIVTNVEVDKTVQIAFLKDVSAMLAKLLRKPEECPFLVPCTVDTSLLALFRVRRCCGVGMMFHVRRRT